MYVTLNEVEKIKDKIESVHGSGINHDYEFKVGYGLHNKRREIVVKAMNAYDVMNEYGFYTDCVRFIIKVPVDHPDDFVIQLCPYYEDSDALEDYLYDLYTGVLIR